MAKEHFLDLYDGSSPGSLRLEEVELEQNTWLITLSVLESSDYSISQLAGKDPRSYKTIAVNAETGEFESMKIRAL